MSTKKYDSSNIKNLQFPENVRSKPTLYIGPIDSRGIFSILREVMDNVVDEALQGRASSCHVYIDRTDGSYSVADDGAGIPVGSIKVTDPISQKTHKVSALKAAVGLLNTSGKFDDKAYAISRGCFVGDTRVFAGGRTWTFKQLYERWQIDQSPIPIPGKNIRTGEFYGSQISHVQLTKHTKELISVGIRGLLLPIPESVTSTPDHPYFVWRAFGNERRIVKIEAIDLSVGDELVTDDNYPKEVVSVTPVLMDTEVPVYDITVDDCHNFFVDPGVLVSNTHGIGQKATNALSTKFAVYTHRDGQWWHTSYAKGKVVKEVMKAKAPTNPCTGRKMARGTLITFKPDTSIFTESAFPLSMLNEWATIAAFFTPKFKVSLATSEGSSKDYYFPNGPKDYLEARIAKSKAEPLSKKIFNASNALVDCVVQFTQMSGTDFSAFTNGLRNVEGGVHLNAFYSAFKEALTPFAKKDQSFTVHDIREGVIGLVNVKLSHPQFDSQTKEKLVDDRANEPVQSFLKKELTAFFTQNKSLAASICEQANAVRSLKDKFKLSRDAIRKIKKISKQGFPINATVVPKVAPTLRSLYLVEGSSASGSAKQARFPNDEILPLKGKIRNAGKSADSKMFASEEVLNIMAMIGYDPDHKDPMSALRVGKVILLADPDPDGPLKGDTLIPVSETGEIEELFTIATLSLRSKPFLVKTWNGAQFLWHEVSPPRIEKITDHWIKLTLDLMVPDEKDPELLKVERSITIECTENHFWCIWSPIPDRRAKIKLNNGLYCIRAEELVEGDLLARHSDSHWRYLEQAVVSKVERVRSDVEIPFYCFSVPGFHCFTTEGGVLSKNCHINSLLLTLFAKYLPEMFERNMIYLALTKPFYAYDEGKDILYTGDSALEVEEQLRENKLLGRLKPAHLKGWGECPPPLLKRLAFDPSTRLLAEIQPAATKQEHQEFEMIMGESAAARRRLLGIDTGSDPIKPVKLEEARKVRKVKARRVK